MPSGSMRPSAKRSGVHPFRQTVAPFPIYRSAKPLNCDDLMTYALATGDYLQHLETVSAIKQSGRRVETAIHTGLMSLATAQAQAMERLGQRIDDRLVEIDATLLEQNRQLSNIHGALDRLTEGLAKSFEALDDRLDGIERQLNEIGSLVRSPEEARAMERFRQAQAFFQEGHHGKALTHLEFAIANDGGPSFEHLVDLQVLKGRIHMGDPANLDRAIVEPRKALDAFMTAAKYLPNKARDTQRVALQMQIGLAAYAARMTREALEAFEWVTADDRGIDRDLRALAHFHAGRAAFAEGATECAARHIHGCIDLDWDYIARIAADPDYCRHADAAMRVMKDYRDRTRLKFLPSLKALHHMVGGASERNLVRLVGQIGEATGKPGFADFWLDRNGPSFVLTDGAKKVIEGLLQEDRGLLDIRGAMERINASEARAVKQGSRNKLKGELECALYDMLKAWKRAQGLVGGVRRLVKHESVDYHLRAPNRTA